MPNWTFNTITINGSKENLDKFMADAERYGDDKHLALSSWMPTPETFIKWDTTNHPDGEGLKVGDKWWDGLGSHGDEVVTEELIEGFKQATKEQREKYGVVGWYDYNHRTFGCKWDSEVLVEYEGESEIVLSTETPWTAPNNWLVTLAKKYPELKFSLHAEYEEGFWEDVDFSNGFPDSVGSGALDWEEEENE